MPNITHRALVLDRFNSPMRVAEVATPKPGPHEVLVRVRALALNPYDRVVQTLGGLFTPRLKFPAVLGSDVSGEVVAVGQACRRLRVGDRIMGLALGADRRGNRWQEGAFQEMVLLREDCCCRLPDSVRYTDAAVLPLALATATTGLFMKSQLGLDPPPTLPSPLPQHDSPQRTVIIWGGATSVGSVAIQLATAAGYRVLSTASPHNHERVRRLGAAVVEDYRQDGVVERIVAAAKGSTVVGLLALGAGSGMPCLRIASQFARRPKVAMASAPIALDRAPIGPQAWWRLVTLPRLIGGFAAMALRARATGVPTCSVWGTDLVDDPLGRHMVVDFAEAALRDGRLIAAPEPLIEGQRLEDIPAAIDVLRLGVSARKVVIDLSGVGM